MTARLADFFKCRKCGAHAEHDREYVPPGYVAQVGLVVIRGECIARRCCACGYAFTEPCADQEASA